MYFTSAAVAFCVAVVCMLFSFAGGLGWSFLLPTLISVLCLSSGAGVSISKPLIGTRISGIGAALCALALIADLIQLINAIPFQQQPEQIALLLPPGVFLLVMILHIAAAVYKYIGEKIEV
jgi:hypothetical protein